MLDNLLDIQYYTILPADSFTRNGGADCPAPSFLSAAGDFADEDILEIVDTRSRESGYKFPDLQGIRSLFSKEEQMQAV